MWKEENEVQPELIQKEDSADSTMEQLNRREPFKYKKQLAAYRL
jgi:hypothetical protein